jgi:hypothetical protein
MFNDALAPVTWSEVAALPREHWPLDQHGLDGSLGHFLVTNTRWRALARYSNDPGEPTDDIQNAEVRPILMTRPSGLASQES